MGVFDVNADVLFAASLMPEGQLDNLATRALNQGLQSFVDKKYEQAIGQLRRAAGMSPKSDIAVNALDYVAKSYVALEDNDSAIKTYLESIRLNPSSAATYVSLGNIYTSLDRYEEARVQYEKAVKLDPSSANRYSLGQGYIGTGQYDEAERQFAKVRQMEPQKPYGDFGLGQAYAKQGRYDEALLAMENALEIQEDYWDAYSEMGYIYMDSGDPTKAAEIADLLAEPEPDLAASLRSYLYEKTSPRMTATYASDLYLKFPSSLRAGTEVENLATYLSAAGDTRVFSMVFQFSKPMDPESVEAVSNWSITRPVGTGRGDGYNYGFSLPTSEVLVADAPMAVYYDRELLTATVLFKITQNADANGTIDPAHLTFKFSGMDTLGLAMDTAADEFAGFSGFA